MTNTCVKKITDHKKVVKIKIIRVATQHQQPSGQRAAKIVVTDTDGAG